MAGKFEGRRVVVTGASRGIGRAIALGFAAEGASVSICARGEEALRAVAAELAERSGRPAHAACCDLAQPQSIADYIGAAAAALGGIDVLVNNASGFGRSDDEAGWAASIEIDLLGTVRACRAALPHLTVRPGASILHVSSISGLAPSVRTPAYGAVKAALIQYTRTQAAQLAGQRIRVNCIAPGSIEFPGGVWDQARRQQPELYARTRGSIPFGRMGTAEEVASVALFLASDDARWVTGQTIAVDGGQMLG
ncbi:MAG: SDR family oxidoreductase [Burkholderiaceae bacterium]|nr:SDR family oxidoreductase [Burkholderiaceae bacterium]